MSNAPRLAVQAALRCWQRRPPEKGLPWADLAPLVLAFFEWSGVPDYERIAARAATYALDDPPASFARMAFTASGELVIPSKTTWRFVDVSGDMRELRNASVANLNVLVALPGGLFAAAHGLFGTVPDRELVHVVRLDGTVVRTLRVPVQTRALARDPASGHVFAVGEQGRAARCDLAEGRVVWARQVRGVDRDCKELRGVAVAANGDVLVVNNTDNELLVLDPATGDRRLTVPTTRYPQDVAVDGAGNVLVGCGQGLCLDVLNSRYEPWLTILLGKWPLGISLHPSGALAVLTNDGLCVLR